jgi:hypothetical protein
MTAVDVRPKSNLRTFLAGLGVSAALVGAIGVAFVGLGAYVAFHGWPSTSTASQVGHSVFVGNGEPASVPSRAAAKALDGASSAVAGDTLPPPALIAAAGGAPLPVPTDRVVNRHPSGGGHNGSKGGKTPPPPPALDPLQQAEKMIDQTPNPNGGGTIGDSGATKPVWNLLDTTIGVVGGVAGTAGDLLLGGSSSSSSSGGLLNGR